MKTLTEETFQKGTYGHRKNNLKMDIASGMKQLSELALNLIARQMKLQVHKAFVNGLTLDSVFAQDHYRTSQLLSCQRYMMLTCINIDTHRDQLWIITDQLLIITNSIRLEPQKAKHNGRYINILRVHGVGSQEIVFDIIKKTL